MDQALKIIETMSQYMDIFYSEVVYPLDRLLIPINAAINDISHNLLDNAVSSDQIKMLSCFLASIPLGFILFQIKNPIFRHIFSTTFGFLMSFLVYEGNMVVVHLQTVIVYLLCAIFGKHSQKVVFLFCAVFLSINHINRQITNYGGWKMDLAVILMMNFCKFISFAFCYSDGFKDERLLSKDQKERQIKNLPNFFVFFSYVNFISSAVAGPTFDFYEFRQFINLKGGYAAIPHPILDTLKNLGIGVVYLGVTATILPKFPINYLITNDFVNESFLFRLIYPSVSIVLIRIRYYAGWLLIQAASSANGVTYNHATKKYDQIVTVRESLEFSHELKAVIDKWNTTVQLWLKRYVYHRLFTEEEYKSNKNRASYGQYATILVSALWHGFYPGYYISFISWALLLQTCKQLYKASVNQTPAIVLFDKLGPIAAFIKWAVFFSIFNSISVGFVLLSIEDTLKYLASIYYFPIVAVILSTLFFNITNWGQRPAHKKQEVKKEQ